MTEGPAYPGTPRWVKVFGSVAVIALVVFAVVHLAGGGFRHHGSSRDHVPAGGAGGSLTGHPADGP